MQLVLKDRVFEIAEATLGAYIPDPHWSRKYDPHGHAGLSWALTVEAKEAEFGDDVWEPRVYHEELRFPVRRWIDLAGQTVTFDPDRDEEAGTLYVFEHAPISRGTLRFLERDGLRFRFEWEGFGDVFWSEPYYEDVPFTIHGWATFTEVVVRGSARDDDASIRARLAEHLDPDDFVQHPLQTGHPYDDGVRSAEAIFTPVER
jgi:hypothetical protein